MSQNYLLFSISWIIGSLAMAGFPQKTGASALQSRASKYMRRAIVLRWLPCPWLWFRFRACRELYRRRRNAVKHSKALHVLPSRDYQSPIARRSDGKDRYSRTLAYVFLKDGTHLNAEIIRQGYGFAVSSSPPSNIKMNFGGWSAKHESNGGGCGLLVHRVKDG
jgi:hypothetical protein